MNLNLNPKEMINDIINRRIEERHHESFRVESRRYIGASSIGHPCDRFLFYKFHCRQADPECQFDARVSRIFQRGHLMEDVALVEMAKAGFVFRSLVGGKQIEVAFEAGKDQAGNPVMAKGHLDGFIEYYAFDDKRPPCELPAVWECKCLNDRNFKGVKKSGLKKMFPKYYDQVQFYMHGTGCPRTLFTCLNANDMELFTFRVDYDPYAWDRINGDISRLAGYISRGEVPPRYIPGTRDKTCEWCDYRDSCGSVEPA